MYPKEPGELWEPRAGKVLPRDGPTVLPLSTLFPFLPHSHPSNLRLSLFSQSTLPLLLLP